MLRKKGVTETPVNLKEPKIFYSNDSIHTLTKNLGVLLNEIKNLVALASTLEYFANQNFG
jgi:hypothetical protein